MGGLQSGHLRRTWQTPQLCLELYRDGVDAWLPHLLVAMNLLGE